MCVNECLCVCVCVLSDRVCCEREYGRAGSAMVKRCGCCWVMGCRAVRGVCHRNGVSIFSARSPVMCSQVRYPQEVIPIFDMELTKEYNRITSDLSAEESVEAGHIPKRSVQCRPFNLLKPSPMRDLDPSGNATALCSSMFNGEDT